MTWQKTTLGACVTLLSGGTPSKSNASYWDGEIPWVSAKDMTVLRLRNSEDHVSPEAVGNGTRLVPKGTLLAVVRGMSLAKEFRIVEIQAPMTFNQDVKAIVASQGVDSRFILYSLLAKKDYVLGIADEAAHGTKRLQTDRFLSIAVDLPDLIAQRRIASILSAYDDLIENNTRRIAILAEMARRIYEEWFVRFRFPGHEKVKMVESELGSIPEGWRGEPLGALLEHHIGGGWGQEEESDEFPVAAYVIRGTDMPDVRLAALGKSPLRFHKESNFRTRKLQPGDIVFEVSGGSKDQPVGRSVLLSSHIFSTADQPIICASFCRLVRANPKAILPELLQLHFERIYDNREIMKYQTQSTGITNFKFTVFLEKELVLVAPEALQEKFRDSVKPLYDLASVLGVKNTNLRTTRDLLLPKLISGDLDVSTLPEPEEAIAA